jgi:hypothetical protein
MSCCATMRRRYSPTRPKENSTAPEVNRISNTKVVNPETPTPRVK